MNKMVKGLLVLLLQMLVFGITSAKSNQMIELDQASWLYSSSQSPPTIKPEEKISLPHYWHRDGLYGSAWYKMSFSADNINSHETWSVFLPQVIMNAQVWVNGHVVGSGGSLEAPIARYWHTPMIFSFPTSLLQKRNTLHIRVLAYTSQHAKLGTVFVGPEPILQNHYRAKYFKSVTLNIVSGVFTLLVSILLLAIWHKRKDSEYFWFAISSLMWSIYSINIFVINIPISEELWEKTVFLSSGWLAISIAFLLVRLEQKQYLKLERALLLLCGLFSLIILITPEEHMFKLFPLWLQFSFFIACLGIGHLAWYWRLHKRRRVGLILLMIVGIALAGLHDVVVQSGWLDLGDGLWLDYSLPLFFLIMGYLLVSRFLSALQETELLNSELEQRVIEAGDLLERNYQKILSMETQQATTIERERIHRDLHDSIGAKLLSLVYRSSTESDAKLARSALSDLRNVVHQTPVSEQSLLEAIYELETACVERCLEAGKSIDFYIHNVPQTVNLRKSKIHNLGAILSEALTNSLKHSNSKSIEISIRYRGGALKFEVIEMGTFGIQNIWKEGFGMKNMRYRVEQLEGKIVWKQSPGRNRVFWVFPIEVV